MKWAPLGLVFLLAFLVPVDADQTYLNLGDCNNSDPGVEALAANGDAMFVGRRDGYIRAIDRDNGRLIWEYPSAYQPDAGVKSIVIDDGTLYAAYSEATNDFVDPVIALDLATGEEVWRQTALDTTDVFRLLLADNVLYAGLNGGSVIAMNPATGKALTSGGNMVRFDPVSFDGTTQPNGIYALEAAGDYIYAARNFGYVTDTGPAIPVNLTHENNTILVLQKGSLAPVGAGTVNAGEYKLQDTDGDTVNDAIFGFATDGTNVYTAGSGFRPVEDNRGRNRVLTLATIGRFPISDTQIQWDLKRYTGDQDLDIGNDNDPDNWANGIFSATDIGYDGSHVYAVTQQGFDIIGGNLLKLDPVSLSPVEWSAPRNFAARDMLSLWVGDGPEDLVVGHACMHASGGLSRAIVSQVQKTEAPSVLLLKPTRGEESDGTIDIELIGYHSNPSVTELTAQFFVSEVGGNCNDGISCYSAIHVPNAIVPVPGFASFNDIPIEVPDGNQIRLRVQVTDPFGNVAVDFAELDFVVDRVAPTGLSITPSASSLVQTAKPLLRVTYADDRAGVEGDDVRLLIGGKNANQNRVYEASGFSVTLGDGNPRLQEGINHVQLVVPDRSGNQAVISQSLILDSIVKTPSLRPTDEGWVQSVREPITAQFSEDVFPTSATFDGVDVLNRLEVVEQAVGTLITYRPTTDHPSGRDAVFELFVEDEAGNHGGPYKTRFRADPDAPLIGSRSPAEGDLLTGDRPLIKFNLRDSGSGLDEDTLSVFVDGEDVTRQVERNLDQFSWEPTSPFKSGTHQVTVSVSDVARNIASTTWNFRVDLDAPSMEASVELPTGQTAVKRGDEVTFTVQVTDQSQLRSVRADLSTISPGRSAAEPMQAVPGFAGRYQLTVPVQDANTHEVAVAITAEDAAGQAAVSTVYILVDNNPPVAVMEPVGEFVSDTFVLRWKNSPKDEAIGGSGVSHYIVDQRIGNGPWVVYAPRVTSESLVVEANFENTQAVYYRVSAVDFAGNRQPTPSNEISTQVRGSPFSDLQFPNQFAVGEEISFTAQVDRSLDLENSQVLLRILSGNQTIAETSLDPFGPLFTKSWRIPEMDSGAYLMQFRFREASGAVSDGPVLFVEVTEALETQDTASESKDSPAIGLLPLLGALLIRRQK